MMVLTSWFLVKLHMFMFADPTVDQPDSSSPVIDGKRMNGP